MACDVNVGRMNMAVFSDEVLSEDRTEQLRRDNRGAANNLELVQEKKVEACFRRVGSCTIGAVGNVYCL